MITEHFSMNCHLLRGPRSEARGRKGIFSIPPRDQTSAIRHRFLCLACTLFLILAGLTQATAAVAVEASVDRPEMAVGQSNTYTITIYNPPGTPQLEAPDVPGLTFSRTASTHHSTRIIQGSQSVEARFSWSFRAERVGRFTIPGREIRIKNQRFRVDDIAVTVGEIPQEMRNRFGLRWQVPEGPFVVGQAIPATLQLFVRAGINAGLGSAPEGSSDQFVRTEFSPQPRQRQEQVNGESFVVVEWDTVITPIRPGVGDLPIQLLLAYETGEVQRDFFGTRARQEQLQLSTGTYNWEVRDLPRANRPESFSGAVGTFSVETRLSRTELEVGDPVTFSLEVRGEGNFERIQAPEFPDTDGWRVYPPRSQMKEEGVSYRGVKTFEYILTPTSGSVEEAPAIAFSWFDPEETTWREIEVAPTPVEVRPGSGLPARGQEEQPATASSPEVDDNGLYPLAKSIGRNGTLLPPWRQPAFWAVNGGLACLLAFGLIGIISTRKAAQNPYLQVRSEAARKAKNLATQAIKEAEQGDALTFYTHARQSLRQFLATLDPQSHNPESLTWSDLEIILRDFAFPDASLTRMRDLFGRKDAVQFAGWKPTDAELESDRVAFERLLNEIVSHKR